MLTFSLICAKTEFVRPLQISGTMFPFQISVRGDGGMGGGGGHGNFIGSWGPLNFHLPLGGLAKWGFKIFHTFLGGGGGQQGFLYWGDGGSLFSNGQKLLIPPIGKSLPSRLPPPPTKFLFPLTKGSSPQPTKFNFSIENIFFQSNIMISKIHWFIKWTVI